MQDNEKYLTSAKTIPSKIVKLYPHFGTNKIREITRLVFEILKRENIDFDKIKEYFHEKNFENLKKALLKRRYPDAYKRREISSCYLPQLEVNKKNILKISKSGFYPKRIYVEKNVKNSWLRKRLTEKYPSIKTIEIESLKDFTSKLNAQPSPSIYNARSQNIFIVKEKYDFFKRCPCTKRAVGCGYNIFNLAFGCIFECTYCYLQEYTNTPGIILPENVENFFDRFSDFKRPGMRIGTGEFSDSLMIDDITGYSLPIIDFFAGHTDVQFEFKTKSDNIKNLLDRKHAGNIVVSWSVNPEKIINKNEFYTTNLEGRLAAMSKCKNAGYKIGIHFDPVFYYPEWENDYSELIDSIFSVITPKDIAWISIGSFRFKPETKKIIEARFPSNDILDAELLPGFDGKLRYTDSARFILYKSLITLLHKHSKKLPIYLCMEEIKMFKWLHIAFHPYW